MSLLHHFVVDEAGIDAIEYGIIASMIFLAIVIAVAAMASNAVALWTNIADHVQ